MLFRSSKAANFICQQIAVSPLDIDAFRAAFDKIEYHCKEAINEVYLMSDAEVEDVEIKYWYPQGIKLPKKANVDYVEQLHTKRQLFSLSLLLHHINRIPEPITKELMRLVFSATLNKTNLTFSGTPGRAVTRGDSGIMRCYRYFVLRKMIDLHVWEQFEQKFRNTVRFKLETNSIINNSKDNLSVRYLSATHLSNSLPSNTSDKI